MSDQPTPDHTQPEEPSSQPVADKGSYKVPSDYYSSPPPAESGPRPRKWWPIGCGLGGCLFIIVLFIGSGLLVSKGGGKFSGWFVNTMNEDIQRRLTVDVPAEKKLLVDRTFKELESQSRAEKITLIEMQPVLESYRKAVDDNRVDAVEADDLVADARRLLDAKAKKPGTTP